jgi:hypothetical protein
MKTILLKSLFLISCIVLSNTIYSQCNPFIPATANVVYATQTVNGGFTPQWVCAGDTLNSGGGIFNVYLEQGAVMNTGGGADSIYVKAGAYLNMTGGIHHIIIEPGSNISIGGGIPSYDTCISIHYDYSLAPAGGCLVTGFLNPVSSSSLFTFTSNSFTSQTTINFEQEQRNTVIKVTDILGKEIKTIHFSGKQCVMEKGEMEAGVYFVSVMNGGSAGAPSNVMNRKILVQ